MIKLLYYNGTIINIFFGLNLGDLLISKTNICGFRKGDLYKIIYTNDIISNDNCYILGDSFSITRKICIPYVISNNNMTLIASPEFFEIKEFFKKQKKINNEQISITYFYD